MDSSVMLNAGIQQTAAYNNHISSVIGIGNNRNKKHATTLSIFVEYKYAQQWQHS